jgi:hypothetical protein
MTLPGSSRNTQPLKLCDKCETKKPPEGGVQIRAGRWYCKACWIKKISGGAKK